MSERNTDQQQETRPSAKAGGRVPVSDNRKRGKLLTDHKQIGKKFIAPFNQLGGMTDISYGNQILPEILWLGLINEAYPSEVGPELAVATAKAAEAAVGTTPTKKIFFGQVSRFSLLSVEQQGKMVSELAKTENLNLLSNALAPLADVFPTFPLRFICKSGPRKSLHSEILNKLKATLLQLRDRLSRPATLMQATATYVALGQQLLLIGPKISLPDFQSIVDYPLTEDSKHLASFIRANLNAMIGHLTDSHAREWQSSFWSRGLEIDPCEFPLE